MHREDLGSGGLDSAEFPSGKAWVKAVQPSVEVVSRKISECYSLVLNRLAHLSISEADLVTVHHVILAGMGRAQSGLLSENSFLCDLASSITSTIISKASMEEEAAANISANIIDDVRHIISNRWQGGVRE